MKDENGLGGGGGGGGPTRATAIAADGVCACEYHHATTIIWLQ